MRYFGLIIVLMIAMVQVACSYSTDFVIVNATDYLIEVSYKVKSFPIGPPSLEIEPSVASSTNVESRDKSKWSKLSTDRYRVDQINRTITVSLSPHEALWVTSMFHYIGDDDPNDVKNFPIQEVSISGPDGEVKFTGDKARKAFERMSRVLYTLSYK